jgi:hypothetical protein
MSKQTIGIGTTANDGTGDQLRTAFEKANDNFTEVYAKVLTDVPLGAIFTDTTDHTLFSNIGTKTHATLDTEVTANSAKVSNATHTGDVTGATALTIASNAITYNKMGNEFKTRAVISALNVNFSTAQVFTKTLSSATTFTFSNAAIGMVKDLIVTGDFALTFPVGSKIGVGEYSGSVSNLIQVLVVGVSDYWITITQEIV